MGPRGWGQGVGAKGLRTPNIADLGAHSANLSLCDLTSGSTLRPSCGSNFFFSFFTAVVGTVAASPSTMAESVGAIRGVLGVEGTMFGAMPSSAEWQFPFQHLGRSHRNGNIVYEWQPVGFVCQNYMGHTTGIALAVANSRQLKRGGYCGAAVAESGSSSSRSSGLRRSWYDLCRIDWEAVFGTSARRLLFLFLLLAIRLGRLGRESKVSGVIAPSIDLGRQCHIDPTPRFAAPKLTQLCASKTDGLALAANTALHPTSRRMRQRRILAAAAATPKAFSSGRNSYGLYSYGSHSQGILIGSK